MNNTDKKLNTTDKKADSETLSETEIRRIKIAIERTDTEKFLLFTRMMRIHFMLKNAVIIK